MNALWIYGAGGHAKVVIDAWLQDNRAKGFALRIVDDDPAKRGTRILGFEVTASTEIERASPSDGFIISVGLNEQRLKLHHALTARGLIPISVKHPASIVGREVIIGAGSFLAAGAIVNAGTNLGEAVIVNTGATVDHDCILGAGVHVAPGVQVCGGVTIGEGSLIGAGATIIPGVCIGRNVIVGAGAVVTRDVPDGVTVVGVPARIFTA